MTGPAPCEAVSVISPKIGVNCPGHRPGLGRGWNGEPPLLCYQSIQKPGLLLNLYAGMEKDARLP